MLFIFKTTWCVFRFRQSSRLRLFFQYLGFCFLSSGTFFLLQFNQEKDSGSAGLGSDRGQGFLLSMQNLKRTNEPDDSARSSSCDVGAISCCFRLLTLFPVSHFLLAVSDVFGVRSVTKHANWMWELSKKKIGLEFISVSMVNCCNWRGFTVHRP